MVLGSIGIGAGAYYSYNIYQEFTAIQNNTQYIQNNYTQDVQPFFNDVKEYLKNMSDYAEQKMRAEKK